VSNMPAAEQDSLPRIVLLSSLAVTLLALALYLRTLHPGVGPSLDSMELQIATLVGGVIHPPGSPQYLMLGRLAMLVLPGPSAAYRLNLFSALCMAATVGCVHLLAYRLTHNLIASGYASLGLAVATRLWYQASIAELYALNALYVALTFYLLTAWHDTRQRGLYWAAIAVYAFSFGNHVSMILLLPAILYIVEETDRSVLQPRSLLIAAGIALLAALQYLYIPLRVMAAPPFCNYCPSISALPTYLTGGPFRGQMFALPRHEILARLPEAIGQFNEQFMPWGYILGIIGGWELFRRRPSLAWFLVLGLVTEYIFVMGYAIPDWHDFLTPCYVLFAPLMSYGGLRLWELLQPYAKRSLLEGKRLVGHSIPIALIISLLLALGISLYAGFPRVNQSHRTDYEINSHTLVSQAQPGAWLLMPHPNSAAFYYSWAVRYTAFVENKPGFTAVAPPEVYPPPGPPPYYEAWDNVSSQLEISSLLQSERQVFVLDRNDERVTEWGLLPLCAPDGTTIAGYEVVAVRIDGEVQPRVSSERWNAISSYVVFGTQGEAHCP
jgi:hypothetical protein